jgi:hypothetical protein
MMSTIFSAETWLPECLNTRGTTTRRPAAKVEPDGQRDHTILALVQFRLFRAGQMSNERCQVWLGASGNCWTGETDLASGSILTELNGAVSENPAGTGLPLAGLASAVRGAFSHAGLHVIVGAEAVLAAFEAQQAE